MSRAFLACAANSTFVPVSRFVVLKFLCPTVLVTDVGIVGVVFARYVVSIVNGILRTFNNVVKVVAVKIAVTVALDVKRVFYLFESVFYFV